MAYVNNNVVVCCCGIPVVCFDDADRAKAFLDRRQAAASKYAPQEAIDKNPLGPFVWTLHVIPFNRGAIGE